VISILILIRSGSRDGVVGTASGPRDGPVWIDRHGEAKGCLFVVEKCVSLGKVWAGIAQSV
jgi:hypothetical protein